MQIWYYPFLIYITNGDSWIAAVFVFMALLGSISFLVYDLILRPLSHEKYKFRFYLIISILLCSCYMFIAQLSMSEQEKFIVNFYIYSFLPQVFLQIVTLLLFKSLEEFATQLNMSFIFVNCPIHFISIMGISDCVIAIIGLVMTLTQKMNSYVAYFCSCTIIGDIFTILFISIPTMRLLFTSLKQDALKLSSKKIYGNISWNIFFILCLVAKIILLVIMSIPEKYVDKATDESQALIDFISSSRMYALSTFLFFVAYQFHVLFQLIYNDSILVNIESQNTSAPSLYLQASENF